MRAVILPLATAAVLLSGCTVVDDLDRRLRAALDPPQEPPSPVETFKPLPQRKPTDVPPPRTPAPRAAAPTESPPAVEAPKPERAPKETEAAATEAPAPDPNEAVRGKLPDELMGISAEQLRARFGPPHQEIEETPGVTWRYRPQGCVLDIHMFPRVESQGLYALDVSSRGLPVEDCLRALMSPPGAETPAAPSDKTKDNAVGQTGADTSPRPADTAVSE